MPPVEVPVRPVTRGGLALRVAVAVLGIGLLLNGSLRASDDVWPFGPLSQRCIFSCLLFQIVAP